MIDFGSKLFSMQFFSLLWIFKNINITLNKQHPLLKHYYEDKNDLSKLNK